MRSASSGLRAFSKATGHPPPRPAFPPHPVSNLSMTRFRATRLGPLLKAGSDIMASMDRARRARPRVRKGAKRCTKGQTWRPRRQSFRTGTAPALLSARAFVQISEPCRHRPRASSRQFVAPTAGAGSCRIRCARAAKPVHLRQSNAMQPGCRCPLSGHNFAPRKPIGEVSMMTANPISRRLRRRSRPHQPCPNCVKLRNTRRVGVTG